MAFADTAKLTAELDLQGNFARNLSVAKRGLADFDARLSKTQNRAFKAGQQIGTGIKNGAKIAAVGLAALASQVALGLSSLVKLEQAEAQTGAVLKSTGQAAGINGAQVTALAEKYEALNATIGDEFIRAGENMLLTFTNIKGKAFEPALEAVLNLNTAMGKGPEGLTKTAVLVGKALNDPTKGLTALTRVGVTFSKGQAKRIKELQKEGKLYEAQQVVLKELEKEFGGSFLAQGGTTGGKVAKFTDSIEDLQRALARALLPAVGKIADKLSAFLADPAVIRGVEDLGESIGSLFSDANINTGANILRDLFNTARDAAPAIQSAAEVTGQVVGTAVSVFKSLPPELQALAVGALAVNRLTGGLVTNIAGGLISSVLKQLVSGVVNVNGATVIVNGAGVPGGGGGLPLGPLAGGAAGLGAGAATGVIVASAVTAAVAGTLAADAMFGDENDRFKSKGLTPAEVAAQRYYRATAADQQTIIKRLGHMPSKTDFTSGNAKLAGVTSAVGREVQDSKNRAVGSAVGIQAKLTTVSRDVARHGSLTTEAIRRKNLSVKVNNVVRTSTVINGRVFNSAVSKQVTFINGLPYGGTPNGGRG